MNTGIELDYFGGYAPIQAWGSVNGCRFYFRARWDTWRFEIGTPGTEVPTIDQHGIQFAREGDFLPDAFHDEMAVELMACFRAFFAEAKQVDAEDLLLELDGKLQARMNREESER